MNSNERILFLAQTISEAVDASGLPDRTDHEVANALSYLVNVQWITRYGCSPEYVKGFCRSAFGVQDVIAIPKDGD